MKCAFSCRMIMKNNSATTKLKEKHTVFENYNDEVKSIMKGWFLDALKVNKYKSFSFCK